MGSHCLFYCTLVSGASGHQWQTVATLGSAQVSFLCIHSWGPFLPSEDGKGKKNALRPPGPQHTPEKSASLLEVSLRHSQFPPRPLPGGVGVFRDGDGTKIAECPALGNGDEFVGRVVLDLGEAYRTR